jgi:hypothetical protein
MKDFFLSHASEDKVLVKEVCAALESLRLSCWLDNAEILPGDSITRKVFDGLKDSKYVILFLSSNFLKKNWPRAELETIVARQIREGSKRVIPFLLNISHTDLVEEYPFFEGIFCGDGTDTSKMLQQLRSLSERDGSNTIAQHSKQEPSTEDYSTHEKDHIFDFEKIDVFAGLSEVNRIRETFSVSYHRAPSDLQVKIVEYAPGSYYGFCNYGFWGPSQATPYRSMHPQTSVEGALNDAVQGIRAFDSSEFPNELVFWVSEKDEIVDGNGRLISMEEAHARREKNTQEFKRVPWTQTTISGGPWWLVSKNFTEKRFSIDGPIEDDTDYIRRCNEIQKTGVDFRIETIEVSRMSEQKILDYFRTEYEMQLVTSESLYGKRAK